MIIQVSVGIIRLSSQKTCLTKRSAVKHLGGLWEFPGGKVEQGESAYQALVREMAEEVGIVVQSASLVDTIRHQYPDRTVKLHFYMIDQFQGQPHAKESQELVFVDHQDLKSYPLPEANYQVIDKLVW